METIANQADSFTKLLEKMVASDGRSVHEVSMNQPVLVVFLRHFGCTFCREALADLSKKHKEFKKQNVHLVLIHMSDEETANRYFKKYNLKDFAAISDPDCHYYEAFGLTKGTLNQLFGLRVWMRGVEAGVVKGHGIGPMLGDGFQMPGVFLIQEGSVRDKFVHKFASDRPNYKELISCCSTEE